ncbi:MAG: glycosyltransferase, partial [Candidatus Moranbacteria bacterium]|nr:glycosyltransferase [Candidatus Moranbacteria bacterium]
MKIALIGQKGIPAKFGGVERHVEELAGEMVKKGHQVFVYARNNYTS